jgi:hypothetical protein
MGFARSKPYSVADKIRHWLIKYLAMGDMILINAARAPDGYWRSKEAGGIFISNCEFCGYGHPSSLTLDDGTWRPVRPPGELPHSLLAVETKGLHPVIIERLTYKGGCEGDLKKPLGHPG